MASERRVQVYDDELHKALTHALAKWDLFYPPTGEGVYHDVAAREVQEAVERAARAAYLEALLGDIPEEAVEAWDRSYWKDDASKRDALRAFLQSVRSSLGDTDG